MFSSRWTEFADPWIPLEFESAPMRYERARLLVILSFAMAALSPLYAGLHLASSVHLLAVAAVFEGIGFLVLPYALRRTGKERSVGMAFVLILHVALTAKAWLSGGWSLAGGASLAWLIICPIAGALLVGVRTAGLCGAAVVGTYVLTWVLQQAGYAFPEMVGADQAQFVFALDLTGLAVAITALSMLFESAKNRAQRQLISAKEEAQEAARLKQTLLTNMSHEIRTPLTSIIGFAELLEESSTCTDEVTGHIAESGHRLLHTLNSVLELGQIEAGEREIDRERVDLADSLDAVAQMLGPKAEEKGLTFTVRRGNGEAAAWAESQAVSRMVQNLVDNAIKFTEEGSVLLESGTDEGRPYLRIRDTGIGMNEDEKAHVLGAFKQASEGLSRSYEGTGLGLTLTAKLTDLLDGDLDIRSEPGEGTDVRVFLPPPPRPRRGENGLPNRTGASAER